MASQWYLSTRAREFWGYRWAGDRGTREWSWKKLSKTTWVSRLLDVILLFLCLVLRFWLFILVHWCLAISVWKKLNSIPPFTCRLNWEVNETMRLIKHTVPDPVYQYACHGRCVLRVFRQCRRRLFRCLFLFSAILIEIFRTSHITGCQFEL